MDVLSVIGSVASIAGLAVTVYVAFRLGRIERSYARQALLPTYARELAGHLKNIERYLRGKECGRLRLQFARCRSNLESLAGHLQGERQKRLQSMIVQVDRLLALSADTEIFDRSERLAAELHGELEAIRNLQREIPWRKRNGT